MRLTDTGAVTDALCSLHWLQVLPGALDCSEQNLEVAVGAHGGLVVQTKRVVRPGDLLFVWFEERVARLCGVPILTPLNIKGSPFFKFYRLPTTDKRI